jgi:hypothetical protein
MNLIEPHRFIPCEAGGTTSVTLPGLHRNTHVDVLRINAGLVLAHSHFSPAIRHDDDIRRPEDQLILAFNLSGRMLLVDPRGAVHEITGGQGWIIRSGGKRLKRIVEKGEGCANLVIALTVSRLAPELAAVLDAALPERSPFRRLRATPPLRHCSTGVPILRQCCARKDNASPSSAMLSRSFLPFQAGTMRQAIRPFSSSG